MQHGLHAAIVEHGLCNHGGAGRFVRTGIAGRMPGDVAEQGLALDEAIKPETIRVIALSY